MPFNEEEFLTFYKSLTAEKHSLKIKAIQDKYNVCNKTAYNWVERYIQRSNSPSAQTIEDKDFDALLDDYKDPLVDCLNTRCSASVKGNIVLIPISDTHFGSRFVNRQLFKEVKNTIKENDRVYTLFVGDMIDWTPGGPRNLKVDQAVKYPYAKKLALKLAEEIGHKCLSVVTGCHSMFGYGLTEEIIEEEFANMTYFKNYMDFGGILDLTVGKQTYPIFMEHKAKGGSAENPIRDMAKVNYKELDFEIGINAHVHTPNIDVTLIRQKPVTFVTCGSFKRLDSYGSKEGYIQQPQYIPAIYLDGKTHEHIPFLDYRNAIRFLEKN